MKSTISRRELIRKFKNLGFDGPYSGGRHQFMKKDKLKVRIPNPHGKKEIHISLVKEILKQAGISYEDWENL